MTECGTQAGYRAHIRANEPSCQPCKDAMAARARELRGFNKRQPAKCGTESGFNAHRRRGEDPCEDCREAVRAARRKTPDSQPRPVAKCGTDSGYKRHRRNKEPACNDCKAAHALAFQMRKPPTTTPKCGTRAGYCQHIRDTETPCDRCVAANREYSRVQDRKTRDRNHDRAAQEFAPVLATIVDVDVPHDWRERAICAGADDPDMFYPGANSSGSAAIALCAQCPVRAACLQEALETPSIHDWGIRGGLTSEQRRNLRRIRSRTAS